MLVGVANNKNKISNNGIIINYLNQFFIQFLFNKNTKKKPNTCSAY